MSNQTIVFVLSVAFCLFLVYRFVHALNNRKVTDRASLHAWAVFFLVSLIAILTVDSVSGWLDVYFSGLPVTVLMRSLLMLMTIVVFFRGIEAYYERRPRLAKYLMWLTTADAAVCIGAFVWFVASRLISNAAIIYLIKDLRDGMMIAWMFLIFIPFSVQLWHREQVRPMKLHRVLDLGFWIAFLFASFTGITVSIAVLFGARWQPSLWIMDRSFTYLCYLLMLIALFPYRWLMPLFYPGKLLLYFRLNRLKRNIKRWSATEPLQADLAPNLAHPDEIELAIYQTVIQILDMYPSMSGGGRALREQIQRVVEAQLSYNEFAQKLAKVHT